MATYLMDFIEQYIVRNALKKKKHITLFIRNLKRNNLAKIFKYF
jgi:hypothetical protein